MSIVANSVIGLMKNLLEIAFQGYCNAAWWLPPIVVRSAGIIVVILSRVAVANLDFVLGFPKGDCDDNAHDLQDPQE